MLFRSLFCCTALILPSWVGAQDAGAPSAVKGVGTPARTQVPAQEVLPLGRLFYSEAQREEMDRTRGKVEAPAKKEAAKPKAGSKAQRKENKPVLVPMVFQFQGLLIQPGQSPMVILNGRMIPEHMLPPTLHLQRNARYEVVGLMIRVPGKPPEAVRVGQTVTVQVPLPAQPSGAR